MPSFTIKCPKATRVADVFVKPESTVAQGDRLIELHDWEEQKIISQIRRSASEIKIKENETRGTRVSAKLAQLAEIVDQRNDALIASQRVYKGTQDRYTVGEVNVIEVVRARQDMALRSYQLLQAAVEHEITNRNISDSLSIFASVSTLLAMEENYVTQASRRLTITSPKSGSFRCYVSPGTPVRLGHVLGEIEF